MVVGDIIQLLLKSGHSERTFLDTSVSMHGPPSLFIIYRVQSNNVPVLSPVIDVGTPQVSIICDDRTLQ